jgi:hypothetical protein
MTNEEKALAVGDAAKRLLAARPHYATLAEVLRDPWAQAQLEEIDRALGRLRKEAARLEAERFGDAARNKAAKEADRHYEAVEYTSRIEGEFLGMLDGLMVDPVLPGTEERVSHALTTIGAKYGPGAVEHCRTLIGTAPPSPVR